MSFSLSFSPEGGTWSKWVWDRANELTYLWLAFSAVMSGGGACGWLTSGLRPQWGRVRKGVIIGKQKVCHDRMEKERKRNRKNWKGEHKDTADLRLVIWIYLFFSKLFTFDFNTWKKTIQNGFSLIFIDVLNGLSSQEIETFRVKPTGFH